MSELEQYYKEQYEKAMVEGHETITALTRAIIQARDSVPPSMSQVIQELKQDLAEIKDTQTTHTATELEHWNAMKPVVDAFNQKLGFWKTIEVYAKYVGFGVAIIVGFKMLGSFFSDLINIKT